MNHFKITAIYDEHECETCGWSCSVGYNVTLNGKPFVKLLPFAVCCGDQTYNEIHALAAIIGKLGYTIEGP
jgi:hypothetical protein